MSLLRKYIWVVIILGMIFVSLVISLIFLIINKCISIKGKHKILQLQKRSDAKIESNKYQERNLDGPTPPLPPRTQFLTADVLGFEELADEHDYEQISDSHESPDRQPDYRKVEEETKLMSPPSLHNHSNPQKQQSVTLGQSYENLAEEHDYEESTDQQPDYVTPDNETDVFLLPPPPPPPFSDDSNMNSGDLLGQSYENLAEEHDYEESTDQQPDYVTPDNETDVFLPPPPFSNDSNMNSGDLLGQSYKNLAGENKESTDQQPDYISVKSEEADPASDNTSEDYDDIGSENEEDYDDVA